MKLASFRHAGTASWGVVGERVIHDAGAVPRGRFRCAAHRAHAIEWLPVVDLNHEMHRQETARAAVRNSTILIRFANSQTGHLAPCIRPKVSTDFDCEGRSAVMIGTSCRHVSKLGAHAQIAATPPSTMMVRAQDSPHRQERRRRRSYREKKHPIWSDANRHLRRNLFAS